LEAFSKRISAGRGSGGYEHEPTKEALVKPFLKAAWLLPDRLLYGVYLPDHRSRGKRRKGLRRQQCVREMEGETRSRLE
jgi:hypothetical protein